MTLTLPLAADEPGPGREPREAVGRCAALREELPREIGAGED